MENITIEILEEKEIEQCRELCDELMGFRKSKAFMEPERFDGMNFDTRMKKAGRAPWKSMRPSQKTGLFPWGTSSPPWNRRRG